MPKLLDELIVSTDEVYVRFHGLGASAIDLQLNVKNASPIKGLMD
jgi:hypothetical protein